MKAPPLINWLQLKLRRLFSFAAKRRGPVGEDVLKRGGDGLAVNHPDLGLNGERGALEQGRCRPRGVFDPREPVAAANG